MVQLSKNIKKNTCTLHAWKIFMILIVHFLKSAVAKPQPKDNKDKECLEKKENTRRLKKTKNAAT
jgi:hypothetical protein